MKILAVKGVEEQGNVWAVRYTCQHGKNVQDALWLCDTADEAKAKHQELLDILQNHDGIYLSKKVKKKVKNRRRKTGS